MRRSLSATHVLAVPLALSLALTACAGNAPARPVAEASPGARSQSTTSIAPLGPTTTAPTGPRTPHSSPNTSPASQKKPNIVFFLTDDQTLDELAVMPVTTREIARRGTTFTRAISQYPLCAPARASLLTGQLAHNHGVLGNEEPWGGYGHFDESETLPQWLQAAGYHTAMVGKYLNGYPEVLGDDTFVPPGWSDWISPVRGAYRYDKYTLNVNGRLRDHTEYQARFLGNTVSGLVDRYAADAAPFFIWAGFLAPHFGEPVESDDPRLDDPLDAVDTPSVEARYRDTVPGPMPVKPSRPEADTYDKGPLIRSAPAPDQDDVQEFWSQRRESLRSVDDAVGQVMRALRRSGELANTLVVFASDNGYLVGEHNINQKLFGFEESIRVPLMMTGPGIPTDVRRDQLVSLTDLPATFLEASRGSAGLPQDGISLLPLVADPDAAAGRSLLLEVGGFPYPRKKRLYTGVRTPDDHVYLRWYDGFEEVYDLAADPYQLDGRTSPAERPLVADLRRKRQELVACVGEECSAY